MKKCPICHKKIADEKNMDMPFCSQGCKSVDLNRWFNGVYAAPSEEAPSEEDFMELPEDVSNSNKK